MTTTEIQQSYARVLRRRELWISATWGVAVGCAVIIIGMVFYFYPVRVFLS